MRGPHNIWRLIRTGATFERTGAMDVVLDKMDLPPMVKLTARVIGWPFKFLGLKGDPQYPPIVRAITALGPAYIKFGQILSTRPDVVGPELAMQLRVLQESLPPFDLDIAIQEIENDLGRPAADLFDDISEPVAAASIAQVHSATLKSTGQKVAIKVLRPGIERAFRKDIDAFYFAANMIERLSPKSRRLRPMEVVKHFDSIVRGELDLRLEAAAAGQFAANTADDENFTVPKVLWDASGTRVMTLDWVDGVSLGDVDAVRATGVNMQKLSSHILSMFLRHALRDGFFHGDMHQGNLKLNQAGELVAFDFGIMGQIDEYTRRVYAEVLMGFIRKDYRRVAEVHFEAGYVPADQDVNEFALALRAVGEPIFGHSAEDISMARLLSHLFDVTERFGMETRTELILLQRTMVVVEGVARTLDPTTLDIWEAARPEVENYIKENLGPKAFARDMAKTVRVLSRFGPKMPQMVEAALMAQGTQVTAPKHHMRLKVGYAALGGVATLLAAFVLGLF